MVVKVIKKSVMVLLIGLGLYGAILSFGFVGVKYGLTNTSGAVDAHNDEFKKSITEIEKVEMIKKTETEIAGAKNISDEDKNKKAESDLRKKILCELDVVGSFAPTNAMKILSTYENTQCSSLALKMILAAQLRLDGNQRFFNVFSKCVNEHDSYNSLDQVKNKYASLKSESIFPWVNGLEWSTIREATIKDKDKIISASKIAGIEPRLLVSSLIVEQLRLFYAQRELFEKFFAPLKILGNATKISLGVMGIKEATAIQIEQHLKDKNSPYYLGEQNENILDYATDDVAGERYRRLTNDKDHYYSYLYGALYLKQMLVQWQRAGYDIQYRPEIVGTLFNVGFPQSKPNPDPKVGGSEINVGDGKYSFGSLSFEFYFSGEMVSEFPYEMD